MKFLHVTDLHLGLPGERQFGAYQRDRVDSCIASINAHHADAELCILTGDLVEHGDRETYGDLRRALDNLVVPYRLIPGNHDRRAALSAAFPDAASDEAGFVQSFHDTNLGRLIFLDTLAEGYSEGVLCDRRLAWLDTKLAESEQRPVFIFMHHPPVAIGIPFLDRLALREPERFLDIIARHSNVAHIFFGHVHRNVHGMVGGVPFTAHRGLQAQFELNFKHPIVVVEQAPPSYGIILLRHDGTAVVHQHEFICQWPRYSGITGHPIPDHETADLDVY